MLMLDRRNIRQANPSTVTCLYNRSNTGTSRCFSQFDRKTDCFDGGRRVLGGDENSDPNGIFQATFKAVCGTQTRPDAFRVKYQADSQVIYEQM